MPAPEYHARCGPSSAKRWLHCPASVSLSAGIPAKTSKYAEAGRLAHAIAELKARKRFFPMSKSTYAAQLKKLKADPHYAREMDGYTDRYVEVLEHNAMTFQSAPTVFLETSVPIGIYTGEKKADGSPASGTADCIQIGESTLWISDYKNGPGVPVDADHNPQMMLYALGALALYAPVYGDRIQDIRMTIIQPALNAVSDCELTREELETWAQAELVPAAVKALGPNPGDPVPGDWCRTTFCPLYPACRACSDYASALAFKPQVSPDLLTDIELGERLALCLRLEPYSKALKEYAGKQLLSGKEVPGWKLVEGRTTRAWKDGADAAFKSLLAQGVEEALLWNRKPVTPPELEKAVGKKVYDLIVEPCVEKSRGAPAIVPASDKRPAYSPSEAAFQEVKEIPQS